MQARMLKDTRKKVQKAAIPLYFGETDPLYANGSERKSPIKMKANGKRSAS